MLRLAGRCGSLPTHLPSCIYSTKICWAHCKALGAVPSVFSWRKWADGPRRAPSEVLQAWAESGARASELHGKQLWVGRRKGSSEGEKHAKPAPCKVQPSLIRWLWGSPACLLPLHPHIWWGRLEGKPCHLLPLREASWGTESSTTKETHPPRSRLSNEAFLCSCIWVNVRAHQTRGKAAVARKRRTQMNSMK